MDFGLLVLLTAVLLLRPEDLFPDLAGLRLYLLTICVATAAALPKLLVVLTPDELRRRPIATCVLCLLPASFVPTVIHGYDAIAHFEDFAKVVLFYFLVVAVLDTPERLQAYLGWLLAFVTGSTTLALLNYHEVLTFPGMEPILQRDRDEQGVVIAETYRIVSSGLFNDPNDLCLLLGLGIVCASYRAATADNVAQSVFWLLPVPAFIYTFTLTGSRGGLLGLLAGLVGWIYGRFGWKKTMPLTAVVVPAILAVLSGRAGAIGGGGTAHERLMFWAAGIGDILGRPLYLPVGLGVGYYINEQYMLAHNSFVQAYVEMGLFGGGLFLGAWVLGMYLTERTSRLAAYPWAVAARPYILAMVTAYAAGCYSLSRNFVVPTYLVLGICTAFIDMAVPALPAAEQVSMKWWGRLAIGSAIGFALFKLSTQFLGQAGV